MESYRFAVLHPEELTQLFLNSQLLAVPRCCAACTQRKHKRTILHFCRTPKTQILSYVL